MADFKKYLKMLQNLSPVVWDTGSEMEKFKEYIQKNWKGMATSIFIGQCFPFWIIPYFITRSWVQTTLTLKHKPSTTFHLLIIILFSLILLHAYKPSLAFWVRYKNNFRLKKIPFTYMDGIFFFVASFITSLFHKQIRENISEEIGLLLIILGILFLVWCGSIIYNVRAERAWSRALVLKELDS